MNEHDTQPQGRYQFGWFDLREWMCEDGYPNKEKQVNREDIIRMAREAGFALKKVVSNYEYSVLERFAALVAAAEQIGRAHV